jgi:molybdopterin-containing oxidoreductase family membrane subunit
MKEKSGGLVAVFSSLDSVLSAVRLLKEKGIRVNTVYSPSRNEELSDALEVKPSPVRWFTLTGGILGILFGYGLAAFASSKWNFIVSGKPTIPIVPFVIISFEFCILFSVFATLLGIAIHARIPGFACPWSMIPGSVGTTTAWWSIAGKRKRVGSGICSSSPERRRRGR